ncbi:MAG: hypothetical protein J1F16_06030 [Muribaculaceae bacterium]|nr:hypothetical protein [Muribaculaceae bacterium]
MKKFYLLTLSVLFCVLGVRAQVTTDPTPLQEDAQNIKIYFHADQGNKGLMGVNASTRVYAHTGCTVGGVDWVNAPDWGDNSDKYELQYVGPNLWVLNIPDLHTYYGVPVTQQITKLAFVFRSADKSKEGKTASNGDIFVDVVDSGLQIAMSSTLEGGLVDQTTGAVTFTAASTMNSNMSISINGVSIASNANVKSLTATYTFANVGDYEVTASATANGETVSTTQYYAYLPAPTQKAYPGNGGVPVMGPVTNSDGSVTFCVAAPEMSNMVLLGSWNNYKTTGAQQMYYTDYNTTNPVTNQSAPMRYFWTTVGNDQISDPTEMYIYFFIVQGTVKTVGGSEKVTVKTSDPYARLVLDPWNDKYLITGVYPNLPDYPFDVIEGVPVAVYQGNINDYDWKCKDFVIPDKDNLMIYELLLRDFTGTEGKADANGTVQQAIAKFDYLKTLGVNVIELLPICEFNGNNSWGYNPNFYFAIDKAYGTPNDYKEFIDLCHENGIAVVLDMVFNQSDGLHPWYQMYGGALASPFYNLNAPHAYSVLNDWNQGYPLVQQQWKDVIEYWLTEYNVDGFRFDLVKGLGLNDSYGNNSEANTNKYNSSRVKEMAYLQSVIQATKPGAYCINENLAGAQEENDMAASKELNWANVNEAAREFAMGYNTPNKINMNRLYAVQDGRTEWSTVSYLESHDEQRLAYSQDAWGPAGVKGNVEVSMQRCGSAAAQMIMTPGSHMIWMFGELGDAQNAKNPDGGNNVDPKKVLWSMYNEPNHRGLYVNYAELNEIRFGNPQFFGNDANFQINCGSGNWVNGRTLFSTYQNQELLTFINPNITGSLTINYSFKNKNNSAYKILSQSYASVSTFDAEAGTVTVPANCYVVIGSSDLNGAGVEGITADEVKGLTVMGAYGEIIVTNARGGATVYSLDGKAVAKTPENGSVSVPAGLYVVRCGKDAVKVMVK